MAKHKRTVAVVVFCILCLLANCTYLYRESPELNRSINPFDGAIQGIENVVYSAAGCPWAYYEHLDRGTLPPWSQWNFRTLACNMLVWGLIFSLVWWRSGTRSQYTGNPKSSSSWRLSLVDMFLFMMMFAGLLGYLAHNRREYAESQKLIKAIRNHRGVAWEACYWPSILQVNFIVEILLPRNRIVGVFIQDPPAELLKQIVALPNLHSLCVAGSGYSLSELSPLSRNPHLQYLRISDRNDLDQATLEWIGQTSSLQALNLSRTNITDSHLKLLGEMPGLLHLNLSATNIELKESICEPWMRAVKYLRLPTPSKGETPRFQLNGLPQLIDVRLIENDQPVSANNAVGLSIANCPMLEKVSVMGTLCYDLSLQRLPNFKALDVRRPEEGPNQASSLKVRRIEFKELPTLAAIDLEIWGSDRIRIEDCPKLYCEAHWTPESANVPISTGQSTGAAQASRASPFAIGALKAEPKVMTPTIDANGEQIWRSSTGDTFTYRNGVLIDMATLSAETSSLVTATDANRLIQCLGNSVGITSLDLAWLPTQNLDLSPIAACQSIKKLNLPATGLSKLQLKQLGSLDLEEIQLKSADDLQTIVDTWPNLRRIKSASDAAAPKFLRSSGRLPNPYDIGLVASQPIDFHMRSAKKLESLFSGDWTQTKSVQLTDLPQLSDVIQLSSNVQSIRIEGAPKLKGLLTFAPWPLDGSIDSMSELRAFAAGGPRFGDDHFAAIEQSKGLRMLTLAYSSVSPTRLGAIGSFVELTALSVTGSSVTDETVKSWSNLKGLQTLMLDRTYLTQQSLPWICSLSSLKHLSMDARCISSITSAQLESLKGLTSLSLYGDGIVMEKLAKIATWNNLQVLKLEKAKLTAPMLTQLLSSLPATLRFLDLCFCQIEVEDLELFVSILPRNVTLGVEGLEVNEEIQAALRPNFRATIEDDNHLFLPSGANYSVRSSQWPRRETSSPRGNTPFKSMLVMRNDPSSVQNPEVLVKPILFAPK